MANDRKRDGGIAAPDWWTNAATARRKDQGIRIEDMAALVAPVAPPTTVDLDQSSAN